MPLDVSEGTWYSDTVSTFTDAGYFNSNQDFRPNDQATRGEFVELVVKLLGGITHDPTGQSFDDVSLNSPLYPYFEEAGASGWVKGSGSCYGSHPCSANSSSPINRAEAAALMIRAFSLNGKDSAPSFDDNASGQWYTEHIRDAASLCILKGDSGSKKVRPGDNMNRAEMVVMLERLNQGLMYPNCSTDREFTLPKAPKIQLPGVIKQNPESLSTFSTPAAVVSSASSSSVITDPEGAAMKASLDRWEALHDEMLAKAHTYLSQGDAGKTGIAKIDALEKRLIAAYNKYWDAYSVYIRFTPDLMKVWKENREASGIEAATFSEAAAELMAVETEFKALPVIWY